MRNRGFIKQYYRVHGVYNPVLFGLGSAATFFKELIRLVFVERTVRGTSNLFRGIRDGGRVGRDRTWTPMTPLEA
jgi:hypothetical protein